MAKLINALFSNTARGKMGGLIYQTGDFGQIVRVETPQRKRPSTKQKLQNYYFGFAADNWRLLNDNQKEEWNKDARDKKMSGFNLFIKETIQHPT